MGLLLGPILPWWLLTDLAFYKPKCYFVFSLWWIWAVRFRGFADLVGFGAAGREVHRQVGSVWLCLWGRFFLGNFGFWSWFLFWWGFFFGWGFFFWRGFLFLVGFVFLLWFRFHYIIYLLNTLFINYLRFKWNFWILAFIMHAFFRFWGVFLWYLLLNFWIFLKNNKCIY